MPFIMRCYFLAVRCLRTKCCLWIVLVSCVLILGRVYQHRRSLFRKVNADSKNASDKFLTNSSARAKHFVPGTFLKSLVPHNVSYCNFRYSLPDSLDIPERDVQYSPELGVHGNYRVVYNVIQASNYGSNKHKNNVTYCTHATPEFFYYLVEILYRWDGPVSIATFVPNTDASLIICLAERLCHCMPDMSRVSLHFVFPFNYPPEIAACPSSLLLPTDCAAPTGLTSGPIETFRNVEGLTYPINVCRNVARIKADTTFILVSDVELFPSKNLVSNFMNMLNSLQKKSGTEYNAYVSKLVFVLPVFEVEASELIPSVKSKLLELYSQNLAFYFHRWVCNHCQRFPGLQRWILRKKQSLDNIVEPFFVVRREFPFHRWEPVFIGTNSEPLYSELLTWEGQQDKMTQMHEMCLLHYRFVILDGGFLVHAPGVKRKADIVHDAWRVQRQRENNLHYDNIITRITERQKENYRCKVH